LTQTSLSSILGNLQSQFLHDKIHSIVNQTLCFIRFPPLVRALVRFASLEPFITQLLCYVPTVEIGASLAGISARCTRPRADFSGATRLNPILSILRAHLAFCCYPPVFLLRSILEGILRHIAHCRGKMIIE
jgi:hypothetical protein